VSSEAVGYKFKRVDACVMCAETERRILGRRLNGHQGVRPRRAVGIATTVVQCQDCGLVFTDPLPIPETISQHYDRPPEDYWAEGYFEEDGTRFCGEIVRFRELWSGSAEHPRALDIGAGIGLTMSTLAAAGFDAYGVEPSAPFRARALERGIDPTRLQLSTAEDALFPAANFDLITFGAVLEHLQDPALALEQVLPWLAPGGLIHVEVPSSRWLVGRLLNVVYRLLGTDYVTNLSPMHPPYHLYEFQLESFRRHGDRCGYELAGHTFFPGETYLPDRIASLATRVMEWTDTGMQLQVWLTPRLDKIRR
jgi:SAM-dependent methyltransferase